MVSLRCKMAVREELNKLKIPFLSIELGVVELMDDLSEEDRDRLRINLSKSGLELLDDKRSILIEKIKTAIIEMIHYSEEIPKVNFSEYLSQKLGYDYTYLSNTFSEVKGITIQQFIIQNKIERVKELLLNGDLTLTEISYMLNYSNVAHLSNQFKKVTGLSPSYYRRMKEKRKINLETL